MERRAGAAVAIVWFRAVRLMESLPAPTTPGANRDRETPPKRKEGARRAGARAPSPWVWVRGDGCTRRPSVTPLAHVWRHTSLSGHIPEAACWFCPDRLSLRGVGCPEAGECSRSSPYEAVAPAPRRSCPI